MREQPLEKIGWEKVDSSNVEAVAFDEKTQTICVRFLNGSVYSYIGADMEIYSTLRHSASVGRYLNNVVKAFPFTRWEDEKALLTHLNH